MTTNFAVAPESADGNGVLVMGTVPGNGVQYVLQNTTLPRNWSR